MACMRSSSARAVSNASRCRLALGPRSSWFQSWCAARALLPPSGSALQLGALMPSSHSQHSALRGGFALKHIVKQPQQRVLCISFYAIAVNLVAFGSFFWLLQPRGLLLSVRLLLLKKKTIQLVVQLSKRRDRRAPVEANVNRLLLKMEQDLPIAQLLNACLHSRKLRLKGFPLGIFLVEKAWVILLPFLKELVESRGNRCVFRLNRLLYLH
mmetsp:Transcript_17162/g.40003  ORF Transcript_17162/g.40003 Transcript_17162/m.40003 type:complete len:212 (+) Transcript_17162:98-733(+)